MHEQDIMKGTRLWAGMRCSAAYAQGLECNHDVCKSGQHGADGVQGACTMLACSSSNITETDKACMAVCRAYRSPAPCIVPAQGRQESGHE